MATSAKIVWDGDCRVVLPLELRPLGDGSEDLWESSNGLVWKKKHLEPEKARQEFQATQLARLLLPQAISPHSPCGVVSEYFVSEKLHCANFDKENAAQVALAARYLGFLHKVDISADLRSNLEARFAHYFGEAMRNRLKEEAVHGQQAFGDTAQELVQRLKTIVDGAIGKWTFEEAV